MKRLSASRPGVSRYGVTVGLAAAVLVAIVAAAAMPARAAQPAPPDSPIFRLPFADPPGPDTWYVIQWYGNTTTAYRYRVEWYQAGQGMHFGVDFSAPCGTEVLAIGRGVVVGVDDLSHGAGPHNLLIDHGNGFASLYGHLLERPHLAVGEEVAAGQPVALSGDPDLDCRSRPHLHLEIRDDTWHYAYNPVPLIDADWDTLSLFGPTSGFQQDLAEPRRWMTPYDQPTVDFWGGMLNNYSQTWPLEWQP